MTKTIQQTREQEMTSISEHYKKIQDVEMAGTDALGEIADSVNAYWSTDLARDQLGLTGSEAVDMVADPDQVEKFVAEFGTVEYAGAYLMDADTADELRTATVAEWSASCASESRGNSGVFFLADDGSITLYEQAAAKNDRKVYVA